MALSFLSYVVCLLLCMSSFFLLFCFFKFLAKSCHSLIQRATIQNLDFVNTLIGQGLNLEGEGHRGVINNACDGAKTCVAEVNF